MIFWAGKSSDDFRVIVEKYPSVILAARKMDAQAVPGRNGDIIFPQAAFGNYVQRYEVYVSAEQLRLPAAMRGVAAWLCSPRGYQTLADSYDIDTYREAYYAGPLDVDSILHLELTAATEAMARDLADRFRQDPEGVYTRLLSALYPPAEQ